MIDFILLQDQEKIYSICGWFNKRTRVVFLLRRSHSSQEQSIPADINGIMGSQTGKGKVTNYMLQVIPRSTDIDSKESIPPAHIPARQATQAGGINFLESIPGLLMFTNSGSEPSKSLALLYLFHMYCSQICRQNVLNVVFLSNCVCVSFPPPPHCIAIPVMTGEIKAHKKC